MLRRALREGALLLGFAAATAVATYPLVAAVRYPALWTWHVHDGFEDIYVIFWDFWWVARCLAAGANPFHTDLFYYPAGAGLFYSPLVPLPAAAGSPLVLHYGDPGGTVLAVNVVTLSTFVLTGWLTFHWLRALSLPPLAALVGAAVFTFAPFRFMHLPRLHYLVSFWLPLYALLFLRQLEGGGWPRALALGCVGLGTLLSDHHHFVFLLVVAAGLAGWRLLREGGCRLVLGRAAQVALVQLLLLVALIPWIGLPGPEQEVARRLHFEPGLPTGEHLLLAPDAKNLAYVLAPPLLEAALPPFTPAPTPAAEPWPYRALYWDVLQRPPRDVPAQAACLALLGLFLLGSWRRGLPGRGLWLGLVLFGLVMALGPTRLLAGTPIPMPYRLFTILFPPLALSRYPAAFVLLALFAAAPVVAWGVAALGKRPWGRWALCAVLALLVGHGLRTISRYPIRTESHRREAVYEHLARDPHPGAVLELPLEHAVLRRRALGGQRLHGRPLAEGCLTRVPAQSARFLRTDPLVQRLRGGGPPARNPAEAERLLAPLREAGIRFVVLHADFYDGRQERVQAILRVLRSLAPASEFQVGKKVLVRLW